MFDNKSNITHYIYRIQLEGIIKAICDISFDIGTQIQDIIVIKDKDKGFTIEDLFVDDFIKEINVRPESLSDQTSESGEVVLGLTPDQFFSRIADHFNSELFYLEEFLQALSDSSILFINKKENRFIGLNDSAKDRLIPALKGAKILKTLILQLKSEKIKGSLQKIDMFENDFFYRSTIQSNKQESQPLLVCIPQSLLNRATLKAEFVDRYDFWLNFELYHSSYGIDLAAIEEYSLLTDVENELEVGLLVGDYLLPYPNVDLIKYISEDKKLEYYWMLLENTYSIKPAVELKKDTVIKDFTDLSRDVELNQLLSYLKNNFYISDKSLIKEKFIKFFNEVVIVENLDFLSEYQFLLSPEMAQETTLGVYSTEKKGDSYNLLHWINHKTTNKLDHFRKTVPTVKAKKIIFTLKPAICYYFLLKYFEDILESILVENKYVYLANHKFFDKGAETEIDFFVNTGKKLYYIETKTKLTKFYIDAFLKKSSSMINKFAPMTNHGIEIEFILIGGYSDSTVADYQYFIENSKKREDGYNTERAALNGKPYYFTVPIPDKQGKQITCIAEPQYENLQSLVLELCQK
ncbi:hypothetical protein [Flavobacterium pectinovorum]|uniref:PD-(D/E)XK nuclease superfamily protein n=1 Tax=Flavobacterium pectinovorum TaxID=29533 RepID=A0AB36P6L6_9FLAO|nr:hypothetical protein [Flavobacterium pectinovorum]OXB07819.1 hypothetical protein B0A72_02840 [Flavobacterium pectinovorum]SHM81514.1 hypothetical protein SAMN05444387_3273 [Flavobacterium pectinovorum]